MVHFKQMAPGTSPACLFKGLCVAHGLDTFCCFRLFEDVGASFDCIYIPVHQCSLLHFAMWFIVCHWHGHHGHHLGHHQQLAAFS